MGLILFSARAYIVHCVQVEYRREEKGGGREAQHEDR